MAEPHSVAIVGMGATGWSFASRLARRPNIELTLYTRQATLHKWQDMATKATPAGTATPRCPRVLVNSEVFEFGTDFAVRAWDKKPVPSIGADGAGVSIATGKAIGTACPGKNTQTHDDETSPLEFLSTSVPAGDAVGEYDEPGEDAPIPKHDVVLVCTKAHYLRGNIGLLRALRAMLKDEGAALILAQNGIPFWYPFGCGDPRLESFNFKALHSQEIAKFLPVEQTVGMVMRIAAWLEQVTQADHDKGIVEHIRVDTEPHQFMYGSAIRSEGSLEPCSAEASGDHDLTADDRTAGRLMVTRQEQLIHKVFQEHGSMPEVVRAPNIRATIWSKLLGNCVLNPLAVLSELPQRKLVRSPEGEYVAKALMNEVFALYAKLRFPPDADRVGANWQKMGIREGNHSGGTDNTNGCSMSHNSSFDDITELLPKLAFESADARLEVPRNTPPDFKVSTLQDFEAGRSLELEALVDAVLEIGDAVKCDLPSLRLVNALVKLRCLQRGLGY